MPTPEEKRAQIEAEVERHKTATKWAERHGKPAPQPKAHRLSQTKIRGEEVLVAVVVAVGQIEAAAECERCGDQHLVHAAQLRVRAWPRGHSNAGL